MPALGPVPAPEVTPAGSRPVPIFPLHVAPCLVSNCVCSPGTRNQGCSPAHPRSAQLGHAQPSTQWRPRAGGGTSVRAFICLRSISSLTACLIRSSQHPRRWAQWLHPFHGRGSHWPEDEQGRLCLPWRPALAIPEGLGQCATWAQEEKGSSELR